MCRLKKSLYGLKRVSRQWFAKFSEALQSENNHSLFTIDKNGNFSALLVYVNDVILISTNLTLLDGFKDFVNIRFKTKDLGSLKFFLDIEVVRSDSGIFINQRKYTIDLLYSARLLGCNPSKIPMEANKKLGLSNSALIDDPRLYRSLVGKFVYLCVTRPDISYSIHIFSQILANPRTDHLVIAHKVLQYIKGAPAQGMWYSANLPLVLSAFCNADWGACPVIKRSVIDYAVMLRHSLISRRSEKQVIVSSSSTETEYRVMAFTCREVI